MTTGSAHHLRWTFVASIPSAASDSFTINRRILYRALAVVVALAALSPLFFGADLNGSATGEGQMMQAQIAGLGIETPAPSHFQRH